MMTTDVRKVLAYTTKVTARTTAAECVHLLMDSGALAVAIQLADKQPAGLSFTLDTPYGPRDFSLPVNADGVLRLLADLDNAGKLTAPGGGKGRGRDLFHDLGHARNVAWRQVRQWLDAQLAMTAAGLISLDEIMIPYVMLDHGETMRDRWTAGGLKAIEG